MRFIILALLLSACATTDDGECFDLGVQDCKDGLLPSYPAGSNACAVDYCFGYGVEGCEGLAASGDSCPV